MSLTADGWRRLVFICTIGCLLGVFLVPLNPVNSKFLKLTYLACLTGVWAGLVLLFLNRKVLRNFLLMTPPVVLVILLFLPGAEIDQLEVRDDYVRRMSAFEGTEYYWGGENSHGIDCSGLPRKAFRDALLSYGIKNANGTALRESIKQWWFDASAKALGHGYRNYTMPLGVSGTIRGMDVKQLQPGDLAVTKSGVHILAYMGDGRWIQADPGVRSVVTLDGKSADNGWFRTPVTIHRWTMLASY